MFSSEDRNTMLERYKHDKQNINDLFIIYLNRELAVYQPKWPVV